MASALRIPYSVAGEQDSIDDSSEHHKRKDRGKHQRTEKSQESSKVTWKDRCRPTAQSNLWHLITILLEIAQKRKMSRMVLLFDVLATHSKSLWVCFFFFFQTMNMLAFPQPQDAIPPNTFLRLFNLNKNFFPSSERFQLNNNRRQN